MMYRQPNKTDEHPAAAENGNATTTVATKSLKNSENES
jgi:hypothetical protein